jgi:hypothetical protein
MPDALISPALRLQTVSEFPAPSLSPSSKLDEGYSDDTRSQTDKDLGSENVMALPNWVLAQSEAGRAGRISFLSLSSLGMIPGRAMNASCGEIAPLLTASLFPC